MTEDEGMKFLLQHYMHRMNEFFEENKIEEIEPEQLGSRFARFLYFKDAPPLPVKRTDGVLAQQVNVEQCADDDSFVMAHFKLFKDTGVALMWMADMFVNPARPLPDVLREDMVRTLRYHADKLESREIDSRMKEVYKSGVGEA